MSNLNGDCNPFTWNPENPLSRGRDETIRANVALNDYALMGPGRSLAKLLERYRNVSETSLVRPPSKRLPTLAHWSVDYSWQVRVAAWEALKQAEAEAEWNRRRQELCEIEWSKAKTLLERAEAMLKHPFTEEIKSETGTIIKPVKWTASDAARYTELASKLMRLAAGLETERLRIEEVDAAIIRELERLAARGEEAVPSPSEVPASGPSI